jgi:CDP-diglyceride synthetase
VKIDWSGARILATVIVCIIILAWAVLANEDFEPILINTVVGSVIFGGFTWWIFPRIVKPE